MRRASKGRDGKNRSGWNMDSNNENPAPQHKDALATPPFDETYRRGPVIMRGRMVPKDTTYGNLLAPEASTDWLHMDPWRVMRIQAEFVDGFGALAELGPAVAVLDPRGPRPMTRCMRPRAMPRPRSPVPAARSLPAEAPASWRLRTAARRRRAACRLA